MSGKITRQELHPSIQYNVQSQEFVATAGQTLFTLTQGSYTLGTKSLFVHVGGVPQPFSAFTETSTTSFTLSEGCVVGEKVFAYWYTGLGVSSYEEVENARISTTKSKTFTYLDNRLESIEQQLGFHSKDIGMLGNDSNNDAVQLNSWITSMGNANCTLYLSSGTYKIASNVSIPSNIIIKPLYGAIIKVYNTFSIAGTNTKIEAGLHQIFDLSLGGTLAGTWNVEEVYPEWFGATSTKVDCHDDIINALNFVKLCTCKTLIITNRYNTAPLVLNNNYKSIAIRGKSPSVPWGTQSGFTIISTGEVGIQLSEVAGHGYDNEVPSWNAVNIKIENIYLYCGADGQGRGLVNYGINGNYDIHLTDVTVRNAKLDGIVLEPQAYPFIMRNVRSDFNGRHGLFVKAPNTTVYNIYDCEFNSNNGYGMYIQDGNTSTFVNVKCQSNVQGGVKVELLDRVAMGFARYIWLGKLTFINLYCEANGSLLDSHEDFEGNCAFYTTSYDLTALTNTGKLANLVFINCNVNAKTPAMGYTSKAYYLTGIYNYTNINSGIVDSSFDYTKCGTLGTTILHDPADDSEFINDNTTVTQLSIFNPTREIRATVGHGHIGLRGRMRELTFTLPYASIVPGSPVVMIPINNSIINLQGYPMLQNGSLFGINVMQRVKPATGTLSFKIKYGYKIYGQLETSPVYIEPTGFASMIKLMNGTGVATEYAIGTSNIMEVEYVRVGASYLTENTDYTVNLTTGKVIPVNPATFVAGTNNVMIKWKDNNQPIVIDSSYNYKSITFPLTKYLVDEELILGLEVTASANYTATSTINNNADIFAELFVES